MSKKNNNATNRTQNQVANVPNPPVPNRAHTEMKSQNCAKHKAENKTENKQG